MRTLASLIAAAVLVTPASAYDLWIRNGTVIDGTGRHRVQADVLIEGDTIAFVGKVTDPGIKAVRTLDARGKFVTPGFIDTHSHGDPATESLVSFLAQGITTVVLGQDGGTAGYDDKPVSLAEWMQRVDAHGTEVNVATLSGHGSLREIAGVGEEPAPTPKQQAIMLDALRSDLAAGAFGMSFGLEYPPTRYSRVPEQKALGDLVGKQGGVVMSHMRSEDFDKIAGAIDELLQIDARVHVSHIKIVGAQRLEEGAAVLAQLERARSQGKIVTADVYPYLASASSLMFLYPDWARNRNAFNEAMQSRRAELEAHLRKRVEERKGASGILFTGGKYAGKTLADVSSALGMPYEKVILDDIGYGGGPPQAHFTMSPAVQEAFIRADHISICTDGAPGSSHPRSADSFVKILEDHVGPAPKMSFERAVYKMSGLAADIVGFGDRGTITIGGKADLLVLSPDKLRGNATWSEPTKQPSGIDVILVNGKVAFENGKAAAHPNGRVLKRAADAHQSPISPISR